MSLNTEKRYFHLNITKKIDTFVSKTKVIWYKG